jgi:putative protein-disulfide isomerase
MCSWCYGFGPQLARFVDAHPEASVEVVMGGLRAYNREPMSDAFREMLRGHWDHVAQASGLPMTTRALDDAGFIYDTEPACRAVVTGRTLNSSRALALLKALQHAFYAEGRDITRARVLAEIAASCGYAHSDFLRDLESEEMRQDTREDFTTTQRLGVGGFPTLVLSHQEELYLITSGFASGEVLEERIDEILRLSAAARKQ